MRQKSDRFASANLAIPSPSAVIVATRTYAHFERMGLGWPGLDPLGSPGGEPARSTLTILACVPTSALFAIRFPSSERQIELFTRRGFASTLQPRPPWRETLARKRRRAPGASRRFVKTAIILTDYDQPGLGNLLDSEVSDGDSLCGSNRNAGVQCSNSDAGLRRIRRRAAKASRLQPRYPADSLQELLRLSRGR